MSESNEKEPAATGVLDGGDDPATVSTRLAADAAPGDGDGATDARPRCKEELRLYRPPQGAVVGEVNVVRMRSLAGSLMVLPDDERPGGLDGGGGALAEAEVCLGKGDTDGARKVAAALTDASPGTPGTVTDDEARGRVIAVRAHLMDGNLDAARAVMGRARDDDRLALADAALSLGEGNVARARERVSVALERDEDGLAEHYTLALIRVAEGEVQRAMDLLARVAASCPEHAVARHQLGQLTLASGDPARAGTLFEMATQLAPAFIPPALSLAEMLVESRQYGEAMTVLGEVTERVPNALTPRLLQLRVLLDIGEKDAALALADALKRAAQDHPEVTSLWAQALLLHGRGEEARDDLERLLSRALADDKARLLRILARLELSSTPPRLHVAVERLEQAVAVAPLPGELRLELAQLHLSLDSAEDATNVLVDLAEDPRSDLGDLLSGAVMSRNHGLYSSARVLAQSALMRVANTPAEGQIAAFLQSLPNVG